ncbi:hypothetical protein DTO021C3_8617 [Paecilomyces variotii]|nr:hypothetical protein DTO021C3_8617 [Paecilomyces variotii]KAJ9394665.1 hypothetical protein DTO282F9_8391 [Paecilomyces variotii]KAJ9410633.1 hypothetical protein DTO045G8_1539 [Paecilomyces variotii]
MTTVNFDLIRDRHALPGRRLSFLTLVSCSDNHVFLRYAARKRVRQGILSTNIYAVEQSKSQLISTSGQSSAAPRNQVVTVQVRNRKFGEIPTTDPAFTLFPDDYLFDIGGSRTREPPQEVESPSFGSTGFRDLLVRGENPRDNFTAVVVLPISTSTDARNVHPP